MAGRSASSKTGRLKSFRSIRVKVGAGDEVAAPPSTIDLTIPATCGPMRAARVDPMIIPMLLETDIANVCVDRGIFGDVKV